MKIRRNLVKGLASLSLVLLLVGGTATGVFAYVKQNTVAFTDDTKHVGATLAYSSNQKNKTYKSIKKSTTNKKNPVVPTKKLTEQKSAPQKPIAKKVDAQLYVDPMLEKLGRTQAIAEQPVARWFGGWNYNITADVSSYVTSANRVGKIPVLVAYNIPSRDCGSYSAGGANSSIAYRQWIDKFASGVGMKKAIIVIEPDALASINCLSTSNQASRYKDLSYAVDKLSRTNATTYLDAGNYSWHSAALMSQRLKKANIGKADGFSLNVSGFGWTSESIRYGTSIRKALGNNVGFIIDTSRNGNGPALNNEWCNPKGRAIGKAPSLKTGITGLDGYIWVKVPGESDGECNGGPSAGKWWKAYADSLVKN